MRDLAIHDDDLIVGTHGRSIWILDDISPLREAPRAKLRDALLLRPAPAYRVARSTWTDTPIPPDEPLGANPPAGAIIDYFLPREAKGVATLEVLDSKGNLVRRYRSDDPPDMSDEELARELIPRYWIALPRTLPKQSGMHRWVWDLRYPAPVSTTRGFPISAVPHATPREPQGPVALAGDYRVRLTVDGRTLEQPLSLKPDPRVSASADALGEQFRLAAKLGGLLTASSQALLQAQSEQKQLRDIKATGNTKQAVDAFDAKLAVLLGGNREAETGAAAKMEARTLLPETQGNLDGLYKDVTRGDAAPTAAQLAASNTVENTVAQLLQQWQQLQAELPSLNTALRAAHLSTIRSNTPAPRDLNVADED
jgi:hypothetical protein